jgi:hypothetical protein
MANQQLTSTAGRLPKTATSDWLAIDEHDDRGLALVRRAGMFVVGELAEQRTVVKISLVQ